jgi:hypothetical protein
MSALHDPLAYSPTGQCCELDEPYQAPPGYFDQPFIYTYDADVLPNGQSRRTQLTTFTGSDFLLRRIAGIDRVCTTFQCRDVLARLIFNDPVNTAFKDFVTVPELLYPGGDGILFDLNNVQKTVNSSGALLSQIIFQGVRRFKGHRRPPSYPYWEDEFQYEADISIDSTWNVGDIRRFGIDIFDYDFELLEIKECIINPVGGGAPCAPGGINQAFKIQLYDQVLENVFSAPIIDDLLVSNSVSYLGVCPVPGIVYRIGQRIRFDLTNLLAVTPGQCSIQVQLTFHGVRRRPC